MSDGNINEFCGKDQMKRFISLSTAQFLNTFLVQNTTGNSSDVKLQNIQAFLDKHNNRENRQTGRHAWVELS